MAEAARRSAAAPEGTTVAMAAGPERNPEKDPQDWATGDAS